MANDVQIFNATRNDTDAHESKERKKERGKRFHLTQYKQQRSNRIVQRKQIYLLMCVNGAYLQRRWERIDVAQPRWAKPPSKSVCLSVTLSLSSCMDKKKFDFINGAVSLQTTVYGFCVQIRGAIDGDTSMVWFSYTIFFLFLRFFSFTHPHSYYFGNFHLCSRNRKHRMWTTTNKFNLINITDEMNSSKQ